MPTGYKTDNKGAHIVRQFQVQRSVKRISKRFGAEDTMKYVIFWYVYTPDADTVYLPSHILQHSIVRY